METNQAAQRREWTIRGLAVLLGIALGWIANDKLGNRYVLHIPEGSRWRIDTHSGKTWIVGDRGWELIPETNKPN